MYRYFLPLLEATSAEPIEQQAEQIETTVEKTVNEVSSVFDNVKSFILEQGLSILLKLIFVFIIYMVAKKVKKVLIRIIEKALERSTMEKSVTHFLIKMCEVLFSLVIVIAIVGYLGIDTSSLVALVGSAGLAVGLALQGSLANFAGGVLILIMKPFKLGDYIVTSGVEGVVTGIDIFYTSLTTGDNRTIVIPNGSLSNANIENVSAKPYRRIDLKVPVEYSANIGEVRKVLLKIADSTATVIKDQPDFKPTVFVSDFEASDIAMGFRVWVETANYWGTKWELMESIKNEFDKNGINIPFDQLEVCIKSGN